MVMRRRWADDPRLIPLSSTRSPPRPLLRPNPSARRTNAFGRNSVSATCARIPARAGAGNRWSVRRAVACRQPSGTLGFRDEPSITGVEFERQIT
jgi:hypothetical protein